ncbi:MAG: IreB family regulatory phosphoprotein [Thermoanaerobacterales bacterium]|nr:IreB family regulatory phosphoprotein [Bacillota bacterium]MDI6907431.1 IreB family regulatory phosphoprotein [Thermoanaerobacterales bacterium]
MDQDRSQHTVRFERPPEKAAVIPEIMLTVYEALKEKGYNPIHQMVGYLISGDPAYITSHKNARNLIRRLERDELLEELLRSYLAVNDPVQK